MYLGGVLVLALVSVGSWTRVNYGRFLFFSGWVCKRCPPGSGEVPILPQGADGCMWKPSALADCGKRGNWAAVARIVILDLSTWMLVVLEHNSVYLWGLLLPCCSLWTEAGSNEKIHLRVLKWLKTCVASWVILQSQKAILSSLPEIIL